MDKRKVIYYSDELNDEFSVAQITPRKIDGSYIYVYNTPFKKFTRVFWYDIVAKPLALLYTKAAFHHRIIGNEVLKEYFLHLGPRQDNAVFGCDPSAGRKGSL